MTEKFFGKYRIPSARMQNWNYGSNAAYFVTICTKNREHIFGIIENGEMILNEIGKKAEICLIEIPVHFPFVEMGAFVVMPNHVHAIIAIKKPCKSGETVETQNFASLLRIHLSLKQKSQSSKQSGNKFGPQSENLASIVRGYKIGVTKFAKTIHPGFAWQPRYYDHIIRNSISLEKIQNYIYNNPINWMNDKFNK